MLISFLLRHTCTVYVNVKKIVLFTTADDLPGKAEV